MHYPVHFKAEPPMSMRSVVRAPVFSPVYGANELTSVCLSRALPPAVEVPLVVRALTVEEEQRLRRSGALARPRLAKQLWYAVARPPLGCVQLISSSETEESLASKPLENCPGRNGARLVLPLLTEVGNAWRTTSAGRPPSPCLCLSPPPAPIANWPTPAFVMRISRTLMAKAGIRQGKKRRVSLSAPHRRGSPAGCGTPLPSFPACWGIRIRIPPRSIFDRSGAPRACALCLNGIEVTGGTAMTTLRREFQTIH